jgi:hypothetical protein
MENKQCSICFRHFTEFGNSAWPINNGRCCNVCNDNVVIPRQRSVFIAQRAWESRRELLGLTPPVTLPKLKCLEDEEDGEAPAENLRVARGPRPTRD